MTKLFVVLLFALVVACSAANTQVEAPGTFDAIGLKLVIGVDRTKTFVVHPDGTVVSSETGNDAMKFAGSALQTADGSKTIFSAEGNDLRGAGKTLGTFDGKGLSLGGVHISVRDDGSVTLERHDASHKLRMHFDGQVVGKKRPALMLVALVFALSAAENPSAGLDRFFDD